MSVMLDALAAEAFMDTLIRLMSRMPVAIIQLMTKFLALRALSFMFYLPFVE